MLQLNIVAVYKQNAVKVNWVDDNKLDSLPMWEGDRYFETWLHQDGFHEVKLVYENDKLIEKKVNHY